MVLDLAHNEASLASLLEVAGALRLPGGELAVVLGTAGDRTDEAIHAMGAMAAAAADRLVVAGRIKYLRGRRTGEMEEIWRAGAAEAGVVQVDESPDELSGLIQLLDAATRRCRTAPRWRCARWSSGPRWSRRSSAEVGRR